MHIKSYLVSRLPSTNYFVSELYPYRHRLISPIKKNYYIIYKYNDRIWEEIGDNL
jgi:hypothetical protein